MSEEQIKGILAHVEKALRNDKNFTFEMHRTQPDVIWEGGEPTVLPTWIKETITISSNFYYNPDQP